MASATQLITILRNSRRAPVGVLARADHKIVCRRRFAAGVSSEHPPHALWVLEDGLHASLSSATPSRATRGLASSCSRRGIACCDRIQLLNRGRH